jgi:hypothetical protein
VSLRLCEIIGFEFKEDDMLLAWSRYSALAFAVGLAIGEAVINWGHWQYAPLWIVDYIIVAWLLWGFFSTRRGKNVHILISAWAFTAGVFYMALFVNLDPQLWTYLHPDKVLMILIGTMLAIAVIGIIAALRTLHKSK